MSCPLEIIIDFEWFSCFLKSEKLKQTQRLQQRWCESEKKPWISHNHLCNCNTYKWQAVNQHITRFPYQFQKTVIHLSLSSLPCSPLALQLHYSTSKWGLRFHMAQYQKSTCSHSALDITAEEEQSEHIWRTGRRAWDVGISKRMLCVTVLKCFWCYFLRFLSGKGKKRREGNNEKQTVVWWIVNVKIMTLSFFTSCLCFMLLTVANEWKTDEKVPFSSQVSKLLNGGSGC